MSFGRPVIAAAISRDRVVVGVSGGETVGGLGLVALGVAAALLAIPIYKRAMATVWEHQHAKAKAAIEANQAALRSLIAQATHAKAQVARYRRKG